MNQASCVVVLHRDTGEVLAATRRGTLDQWGMVGGKQDEGESPLACAKREFAEETGITLGHDPWLFWTCIDNHGYECSLYFVDAWDDLYEIQTKFAAHQTCEGDIRVGFVPWQELLRGPFAEFNWKMMHQLFARFTESALAEHEEHGWRRNL